MREENFTSVNGRKFRSPGPKKERVSVPRSRPSQKDSIANREMMDVNTFPKEKEVPKKKNPFQSFFSNSSTPKSSQNEMQKGRVGIDSEEQLDLPISRPSQLDSRSMQTGPSLEEASGTSPSNMRRRASQGAGSASENMNRSQTFGSSSVGTNFQQGTATRATSNTGSSNIFNGIGGKLESMGKNKAKTMRKSSKNVAPLIPRQKEAPPRPTQWENRGENLEEIAIKQEMNGRYIKDPKTVAVEKPRSSLSNWDNSNSISTKVSSPRKTGENVKNPFGPGYNDPPSKQQQSSSKSTSSGVTNGRQFLQNLSSKVAPKSKVQQKEVNKQPQTAVKRQPARAATNTRRTDASSRPQPARVAANTRTDASSRPQYGSEVSYSKYA